MQGPKFTCPERIPPVLISPNQVAGKRLQGIETSQELALGQGQSWQDFADGRQHGLRDRRGGTWRSTDPSDLLLDLCTERMVLSQDLPGRFTPLAERFVLIGDPCATPFENPPGQLPRRHL